MITIAYNDSNVTLYRIPINGNETKVFTLLHQSDPRALQTLINWFNHTINNETMISTTNKCYGPNFFLIIGGLVAFFVLVLALSIFFMYRQRPRHHWNYRNKQRSVICVTDDNSKTNISSRHLTNYNSDDDNDNGNDNQSDEKEGVSK